MEKIIFKDGTEVRPEMFSVLPGMIIVICNLTPAEVVLNFGDETKLEVLRYAIGNSERSFYGYKLDFVSVLDGKANVILKQV